MHNLEQQIQISVNIGQNICANILVKSMNTYQLGGQKGPTGYCFKYIDRPFCLKTDDNWYGKCIDSHVVHTVASYFIYLFLTQ